MSQQVWHDKDLTLLKAHKCAEHMPKGSKCAEHMPIGSKCAEHMPIGSAAPSPTIFK